MFVSSSTTRTRVSATSPWCHCSLWDCCARPEGCWERFLRPPRPIPGWRITMLATREAFEETRHEAESFGNGHCRRVRGGGRRCGWGADRSTGAVGSATLLDGRDRDD